MSAKSIARDAVLAAMVAVLGMIAIDLTSIKITFEALPILLGALLFGPAEGAVIAFTGTFVYQLIRYGVSATTLLWIAPYVIAALIAGSYAKKKGFKLSAAQTVFIAVISELIITILNTGVMYADAKMYAYYFPGFITGTLAIRLVVCVVKSVAEGAVLPELKKILMRAGIRTRGIE